MIDIGTRKHGPFDPRYPRPRTQADGRGNGHRPLQPETRPDGLSWERFYLLAYPGMKRHYFPAIAPWYGYRDRDCSSA
jgi:hypothetical protein